MERNGRVEREDEERQLKVKERKKRRVWEENLEYKSVEQRNNG